MTIKDSQTSLGAAELNEFDREWARQHETAKAEADAHRTTPEVASYWKGVQSAYAGVLTDLRCARGNANGER